ncbi:DUF6210 family protein [Deinococcus taeanensis]|uniref:DUF6210 family protein n=1 Tax=Deinococcus taeanensis TaxID=2737050 RepID=UPI001CDC2132|nr:DUF6210 family protein [Deinococcus taeanensis]UBV42099.1 DUF6210 family protein [Deinococcus taeanensis]
MTARAELAYIFIDPDGTQGAGVVVVVQAPTGVVYASQVGGNANEERSVEGFAIPLFHPQYLDALEGYFGRYSGNLPYPGTPYEWWKEKDLQVLAEIVGRIPLWHTSRDKDEPAYLQFDGARLEELTEGWVPVVTRYGPGILTHQNCD